MSVQDRPAEQESDTGRRPYSIDLTLELEQQLENESNPPSSPAATGRPQSIDTNVLASIITQLRTSLTDVTRERDELARSLSEIRAREADMKDALAHLSEKCSNLQDQVDKASEREKEDENTISVLRGKVEESRRGLMRLQSESRRASQVPPPLDISRAGQLGGLSISSAKRASFAPLTGSGAGRTNSHRRISSVTDASSLLRLDGGASFLSSGASNSPDTPLQHSRAPISSSRRSSAFFAQSSPPTSLRALEDSPEVEMLRKEIGALKSELAEARHELSESNEAREASELCVKALRAFIEENNVGVTPTTTTAGNTSTGQSTVVPLSSQEEQKKSAPSTGGWAFRLWRAEASAKDMTPAPPSAAPPPPVQSPPPQPLTRKLGDFFGTKASASSMAPVRLSQTEREPMCSAMSDSSSLEDSVAEPLSPASEFPRSVLVRDSVSVRSSSSRDLNTGPDHKAETAIEGVFTPVAL
ncbi:hypothetical protein ID866_3288 [Astraeus odoratus]|nr:hypothetical protein ID866_3288 [Astraeus odoratus]